MFEAKTADADCAQSVSLDKSASKPRRNEAGKAPVLVVLHQRHSTPGHVGQQLVRNGHPLDIRRPRFGDPLPVTLEKHAGVAIFGGPMSANDPDDFIRAETEFIGIALEERKPFLGICLGAQMLANFLGAKVDFHPGRHVEIGYHPVSVTKEGKEICDWPDWFYQWHREGFETPSTATVLATADGPFNHQAFVYDAAVAVQFHPEITFAQVHCWTGHYGHRLSQPGASPREDQISGHFLHAPRVHRWLGDFLVKWLQCKAGPGIEVAQTVNATL